MKTKVGWVLFVASVCFIGFRAADLKFLANSPVGETLWSFAGLGLFIGAFALAMLGWQLAHK